VALQGRLQVLASDGRLLQFEVERPQIGESDRLMVTVAGLSKQGQSGLHQVSRFVPLSHPHGEGSQVDERGGAVVSELKLLVLCEARLEE